MTAGTRPRITNVVPALSAHSRGIVRLRIAFVCGGCERPGDAVGGSVLRATNHRDRLCVHCAACNTWNMTDLVTS